MNMANTISQPTQACESRAVEILTSASTGNVIGYRLGGGRPGPNLLVSGYDPQMHELFGKLIEVPTIPWMWGKLYLVSLNALDEEHYGRPLAALEEIIFDETVFLPPLDAAMDVTTATHEHFKTVLRACAGMGMILGRGTAAKA